MAKFIPCTDTRLNLRSEEIPLEEIQSLGIQQIIEKMFMIAKGERSHTENGSLVGLAAPQIGVWKRIILVDIGADNDEQLGTLKAYINPEITWMSSRIENGREDCYSIDSRVYGIVPRAYSIKVRAYDRVGRLVEEEHRGFVARIFQHEVDHLEGIRFPDRVGKAGKLHWVSTDQVQNYRHHEKQWQTQCPWTVWQNMKAGKTYEVE
jgi:peptide deformylase